MILHANEKISRIAAFFLPLAVYVYQLCPTVYVHDSGELITAAYVLGVPHPAGSPLYCIVGKLFQLLIPTGNIAFRMNAMSAFFASLAAVMLFSIIHKITRNVNISFAVSLAFAFSKTFWSQALVAEVYTMSTFIFLSALYFFIDYFQTGLIKKLYYFGLLWGLLLSTHMEYALLSPFIWIFLLYQLVRKHSFKEGIKAIILVTLFFIAGMLPYLYLPIASSRNPVIDWGNVKTFTNFIYHFTARNVQKRMFQLSSADYFQRFSVYMNIIFTDTVYFGILGIAAIIIGFKKLRYVQFMVALLLLVDAFFIIFLDEVPIQSEAYGIPSVLAVSIGFSQIIRIFIKEIKTKIEAKNAEPEETEHDNQEGSTDHNRTASALIPGTPDEMIAMKRSQYALILFIMPLLFLVVHFTDNNRNSNFIPYDYNLNMIEQVPMNSVLFTREDNKTFVMVYLQAVEGIRKDLRIYDTANNIFRNPYHELFFLLPAQSVILLREKIESAMIRDGFQNREFVFYTDPDMPYATDQFKVQPCGLLGVAVPVQSSYTDFYFCKAGWIMRGENDPEIHKDWMTNAILAMNYYNLAQYQWLTNPAEALKSMEKASIHKNDYAELHYMLGRSYMHNNYYDKALEEFAIAAHVNHRLWQTYVQSSFLLGRSGKYKEAIEQARSALELDDTISEAHENLALASYKVGEHQQAEIHFRRAAELEITNATYVYNLINFYIKTNNLASAESYIESHIDDFQGNERVLVILAKLYQSYGKWQELNLIAEKLIELSPHTIDYYYLLAESAIRTGNYELAHSTAQKMLEVDPNNQEAKQLLNILKGMQ